MAVSSLPSGDGNTLTIKISEKFDFNAHSQLRAAYRDSGKRYAGYIVDLRDTSYMDSSALGMLLQLKEYAGGSSTAIRIRNAPGSIRDILRVANFEKLMVIE